MTAADSNPAVDGYLGELTRRLEAVLGDDLVGVYAGGSYALGEYEAGRSDLDVAAIVRAPLPPERAHEVVGAIRHEALPCPARGLEFVVYPLEVTRAATVEAGFWLNLNTGREMPLRVDLAPQAGEEHWFPIDRSILAEHGVALAGPPAREVFASPPRELLLPALLTSLEWHGEGAARADDVVLNSARSLRYVLEGTWSSKRQAGRWALAALDDAGVVADALAARSGGAAVDPVEAERFRSRTLARLGLSPATPRRL